MKYFSINKYGYEASSTAAALRRYAKHFLDSLKIGQSRQVKITRLDKKDFNLVFEDGTSLIEDIPETARETAAMMGLMIPMTTEEDASTLLEPSKVEYYIYKVMAHMINSQHMTNTEVATWLADLGGRLEAQSLSIHEAFAKRGVVMP